MFISKSKYVALIERIERLEKSVVTLERDSNITVYESMRNTLFPRSAKISIMDVVRELLRHGGLKLEYKHGQQDRAEVVKNDSFSMLASKPDVFKL